MRYLFNAFLFFVFVGFVASCSGDQRTRLAVTPTSYGKLDNIMVIADEYTWTTTIGDTFRNAFEALYPVTPQPEPIYDLHYYKPLNFKDAKVLKTHRAIIILGALDDMNDPASQLIREGIGKKNVQKASSQTSYRMAIHKDRWAKGQKVIYWFAPTRDELLKTVAKDYQRVMNEFNKADTEMFIEQIYLPGQNLEATNRLHEGYGIDLKIPRDYTIAHDDSSAIWMRKETDKISNNIFIYSLPYSDTTDLTPEYLKQIRNQLTKKYISTHIKDSYMQIDDRVLPMYFQELTLDNNSALQARGLWGMVNDFMGGSFVTYMIDDKKNSRYLILDGFVHAPGQKKRPEMRRLDMIFSTFSFSK